MLIVHRCKTCGTADFIGCSHKKKGDPEVVPTFDVAGRKVERIVAPGERLGTGLDNGLGEQGGGGVTACGCAACKALYADLTTI